MASAGPAVTIMLIRTSQSRNSSSTRLAVRRIHDDSFVYGSRTTDARWNVVSHSMTGRASPERTLMQRGQDEVGGKLESSGPGRAPGGIGVGVGHDAE